MKKKSALKLWFNYESNFPNQNILVKYREVNAGTKILQVNLFSN